MNSRDKILVDAVKHHSAYVAYAFGIVKSWSSAEDVVQNTYVVIAESWASYQGRGSLFCWTRSIVRNKAFEFIRANKQVLPCPWLELAALIDAELESFVTESTDAVLRKRMNALSDCFKGLKPRSRQMLYDFYVKKRTCKDIAASEDLHPLSPANNLFRLRKKLRKCIREKNPNDDTEEIQEKDESLLDAFFAGELAEEKEKIEEIKNLLHSQSGDTSPILRYIFDWSTFALTLLQIEQETAEGSIDECGGLSSESIDVLRNNIKPEKLCKMEPLADQSVPLAIVDKEKTKAYSTKLSYLFGVAALTILSVGLWQFFGPPNEEGAIGAVVAAEGGTLVNSSAQITSIDVDQIIYSGQGIRVSENGRCSIRYLNEDINIEINGTSQTKFFKERDGMKKRIVLDFGKIVADIQRQANDAPFIIQTPQAEVTVLGTRFKLVATPHKTSLSLQSGLVLFKHNGTGIQKRLTAGQYATTENGTIKIGSIESTPFVAREESISMDNGLIAHYKFDEKHGKIISDSSSMGFQGVYRGAGDLLDCWTEGRFGSALIPCVKDWQSEVSKGIRFEEFPSSEINNTLSVSLWVYPLSKDGCVSRGLLHCSNDATGEGWIVLLLCNPDYFRIGFQPNANARENNQTMTANSANLKMEKWNHVVIVYDSGLVNIYNDGQLTATKNVVESDFRPVSDQILKIILSPRKTVIIDEIAIFNRRLHSTEIVHLTDKKILNSQEP